MTTTTEHNVEEKGRDKISGEDVSDGSTRDKPTFEYAETTHHAAAMGQYATDKYVGNLFFDEPTHQQPNTDSIPDTVDPSSSSTRRRKADFG